jgi:hypothetical protein
VNALRFRLDEIDDQFEACVPEAPADAAALVRYLKHQMDGCEWCERQDRIADNLIAGLEQLARRVRRDKVLPTLVPTPDRLIRNSAPLRRSFLLA